MRKTARFAALCALLASPLAFADSETRDLDEFSKIRFMTHAEVTLIQGNDHRIEITADSDLIERLETTVSGDQLTISLEDKWFNWFDDGDLTLVITFEDLEKIAIHGSSNIEGEGFALNDFEISIKGSGDVDLEDLSAEHLDVNISGSGDVHLTQVEVEDVVSLIRGSGDIQIEGRATTNEITIQGSGDVTTDDLQSDQVSVVVAGSGNAQVYAESSLDARVRGSGDISYKGSAEVTQEVLGSGDITKM